MAALDVMREAQEEADVAAAITQVFEFQREEDRRMRERRAASIRAQFATYRKELNGMESFQKEKIILRHTTEKQQPCSSKCPDPAESHRRELTLFQRTQNMRHKMLDDEQRDLLRSMRPEEEYRASRVPGRSPLLTPVLPGGAHLCSLA